MFSRHEFRKIFVGGLAPEVTEKDLLEYFSKFGPVKDSVVMIDRKTSRSRGFGFVTFDSDDALNTVSLGCIQFLQSCMRNLFYFNNRYYFTQLFSPPRFCVLSMSSTASGWR